MRPHIAACCLFVGLCLVSTRRGVSVDASTVQKLSIEDLAVRCEVALEARVTSKSSTLDAHGRIGTDYALSVAHTFAGAHLAQRTIRLPGGVLADGRGLVLSGLPELVVGEDAILFLSGENPRGERLPLGLAQGRLRVERTAEGARYVVLDAQDLELVDGNGRPVARDIGPCAAPYAAIRARIEAACALRGKGPAK